MNYPNFTPNQKVLAASIVNKVEHSGCSTDEIVEVLSEVCGSLLAYMAPTREELTNYLDNQLLPGQRRVALEWNDLKSVYEQYGNV